MDISVEAVSEVTPELLADLERLLPQLLKQPPAFDPQLVEKVVSNPDVHLFVAKRGDGRIVGTGQLCTYPRIYGPMAWVEGVVVDDAERGKGIAGTLVNAIIARARELGLPELNLTSGPHREAANHLYQKLGFERYDTNYYRMKL